MTSKYVICNILGIQLAEISTLPPSVVEYAKQLAVKIEEEKKVRLLHSCFPTYLYVII
jgi:hypothetical protein